MAPSPARYTAESRPLVRTEADGDVCGIAPSTVAARPFEDYAMHHQTAWQIAEPAIGHYAAPVPEFSDSDCGRPSSPPPSQAHWIRRIIEAPCMLFMVA